MRTAFCDLFTPARPLDNVRKTGVEMLLNRATAAAVDLASRAPKPDLAAIAKDADTLGLSTLATAARQADADEDTLSSIKLAYVASELSDSHCTSFQ